MDLKKFSLFIMLAGAIVTIVGLVIYGTHQPLTRPPDQPANTMEDISQNLKNRLGTPITNSYRREKRSEAQVWMIVGGVILFTGLAINLSAKKQTK
jgi:hypothetical protein